MARYSSPSRQSSARQPGPSTQSPHLTADPAPAPEAPVARQGDGAASLGHRFEQVSAGARGPSPREATPAATPRTGGTGKPLPLGVRAKMEQSFGHDFSRVRIHERRNPAAPRAVAATQGENIHFAPGHYRPDSHDGQSLLGHELTHVVQQRAGQVAAPQGKGFPVNDNLALEAEADRAGSKAARGEPAHVSGGGQGPRTTPGDVAHASGCGCTGCHTSPAASGSNAKVFQLKGCGICGSQKHREANCPANTGKTKQDRDEHEQELKRFQQAKAATLEDIKKSNAMTPAFAAKHQTSSSSSLGHTAKEVANKRTWGGGSTSGMSTVAVMTAQQQKDERRYAIEGLKMKEATVRDGMLDPNLGVNKPTKFNYVSQTSQVTSDRTGKRTVKDAKPKLSQPVLGLRGSQIHHLHKVDEAQ